MSNRVAFVLAAVTGGPMIVNRLDWSPKDNAGVGAAFLEEGAFAQAQIDMLSDLALARRESHGFGVVVVDGGANVGAFTIQLAKRMTGWGMVFAFEPQERVFYALAGNVALNNCFNAKPLFAALTGKSGQIRIPTLDHQLPANFGGLALRPDIVCDPGQALDYTGPKSVSVPAIALDDFKLPRLDILKLDIEGMEPEALLGATTTITRCKPLIFAEADICGNVALARALPEYQIQEFGKDALCIHRDDPIGKRIRMVDGKQADAGKT